jgi:hypothetical protein
MRRVHDQLSSATWENRGSDDGQQGLVPNSPAWINYWWAAFDRILSGGDPAPTERISMAFVDLILEEAQPDELLGILSS